MRKIGTLALALLSLVACDNKGKEEKKEDAYSGATKTDMLYYEGEDHLKNIRQISFGGDNAEAYWSFDDSKLVFQATNKDWGAECDQIYIANSQNSDFKKTPAQLVSTGYGRTTCSYFLPGDTTILYASTHATDTACPAKPEKRADGKYVWPIYSSFDIYVADLGGHIVDTLTNTEGYDAEATVSPQGDKIVFTSLRTGDLELFTMNIDGSDVKQITTELGYDGGAFFSPDGKKLIFRSSRPTSEEDVKIYKDLLLEGLVMPTEMELYMCDVDGSNMKQLTNFGSANWCPFFLPGGDKVIFASNHESEKGFPFNLYTVDTLGNNLEKISGDNVFDAFPVFSNSGKYLVFSSNRNNGGTHETNLFMAEWED